MRCDDIAELFKSFQAGRAFVDQWDDRLETTLDRARWLAQRKRYARDLNALYDENKRLCDTVLKPMIAHPETLTDEECDCLYDWTRDMYLEDYDDPYTLASVADILIPHYEQKNDLEHLIFCYQFGGYAALEMSRCMDKRAGHRSINLFLKVLRYQDRIADFQNDYNRIAIFVAYSNLLRTETSLNNLSVEREYAVWQAFHHFREQEIAQSFDEQLPRIPSLCEFMDSDFRAYCAEDYFDAMIRAEQHRKPFQVNPVLEQKLIDVSTAFLEPMVLSDAPELMDSPEFFFNYIYIQVFQKRLTWEAAWQKMEEFHDRMLRHPNLDALKQNDPLGSIINPLRRMVTALYYAKFSADEKSFIAQQYSDEILALSQRFRTGEHMLAMHNALADFCFDTELMSLMKNPSDKERTLLSFVVTRQTTTYIHSLMVAKATVMILESVLENAPELLAGMPDIACAEDALRQRKELIVFAARAALFHDVGKNSMVGVITTQHRVLSDREFALIRRHPEIGAEHLLIDPSLARYHDVALGHHRFFDGSGGYPSTFDNVHSSYKPLIDAVTLADCLDAATDHLSRNYQRAKTYEQVLAEFEAGAGVRYHPGYVALMSRDERLRGRLSRLISTGRESLYFDVYSRLFSAEPND